MGKAGAWELKDREIQKDDGLDNVSCATFGSFGRAEKNYNNGGMVTEQAHRI